MVTPLYQAQFFQLRLIARSHPSIIVMSLERENRVEQCHTPCKNLPVRKYSEDQKPKFSEIKLVKNIVASLTLKENNPKKKSSVSDIIPSSTSSHRNIQKNSIKIRSKKQTEITLKKPDIRRDRFIFQDFQQSKILLSIKNISGLSNSSFYLKMKIAENAKKFIYQGELKTALLSPNTTAYKSQQGSFLGKRQRSSSKYQSPNTKILKCLSPKRVLNFGSNRSSVNLFNSNKMEIAKKYLRLKSSIRTKPIKILEAPDMLDDFYLNLLDWSSQGMIGISLQSGIYCWNQYTNRTDKVMNGEETFKDVTCVNFSSSFLNSLAISDEDGSLSLYDISKQEVTMRDSFSSRRIAAIAWQDDQNMIFGDQSGRVHLFDVRTSKPHKELHIHSQEICQIQINGALQSLATGGNDNKVNVLDLRNYQIYQSYSHEAAVKAIAWYPHRRGALLTGGGFTDKTFRMIDTLTGKMIASQEIDCQITGIRCSTEDTNILTIHGYPLNNMSLWEGGDLQKITDFEGHSQRILYYGQSPDQNFVATAASDETVQIWKCFSSKGDKYRSHSLSSTYRASNLLRYGVEDGSKRIPQIRQYFLLQNVAKFNHKIQLIIEKQFQLSQNFYCFTQLSILIEQITLVHQIIQESHRTVFLSRDQESSTQNIACDYSPQCPVDGSAIKLSM